MLQHVATNDEQDKRIARIARRNKKMRAEQARGKVEPKDEFKGELLG